MVEMAPEDERKTERLFIRSGPQFKALLEQCARDDRRELADWIRLKLEKAALEAQQRKRR